MNAKDFDSAHRLSRRDALRTLGLLDSASTESILQGYLKLRRALRSDSAAMRDIASDAERRDMLERVERAYRELCSQAGVPQAPPGRRRPQPSGAPAAGAEEPRRANVPRSDDPVLDLRSRPSPFRARPSRPLSSQD